MVREVYVNVTIIMKQGMGHEIDKSSFSVDELRTGTGE